MSQSLIEELGKLKAYLQKQAEDFRQEGVKYSTEKLALSAARAFGQVVAYEGVVVSLNEIMESHGETTPAPAAGISPKDLFSGLARAQWNSSSWAWAGDRSDSHNAAGRLAEEATAADSTSALDTFAGQAMQGWMASYSAAQVSNHPARITGMAGIIAKDSYVVAEAMVREQSKRTKRQWSASNFCRKGIAEDTGLGIDVINRVFDACEKRSTK